VVVPFNFRRASQFLPQHRDIPLDVMTWDDDVPRKLFSEDGFIMVASIPRLTNERGTVCSLCVLCNNANKNCRHRLRIVSLSMPNIAHLTWESLRRVMTKPGDMLNDRGKFVAKFDL
jgi:hypothetical protein